jgi:hypothetical protein
LINLRARQLSTETGRFLEKDTWQGDYNIPESYNAWLFGYSNPLTYEDPTGQTGYNRSKAMQFAWTFDRDAHLPIYFNSENDDNTTIQTYDFEKWGSSLCTVFASMVLWEGGIRDNRTYLKPPRPWDLYGLRVNPDNTAYYPGYHIIEPDSPWSNTLSFYKFLTNNQSTATIEKVLSYEGTIPQYYGGNSPKEDPLSDWDQQLSIAYKSGHIQEGDLVFYQKVDSSNIWDHVAVVTGWGFQTSSYQWGDDKVPNPIINLPIELPIDCDHNNRLKPRVIEKSGAIAYQAGKGRSIDNTSEKIGKIEVFHIQ